MSSVLVPLKSPNLYDDLESHAITVKHGFASINIQPIKERGQGLRFPETTHEDVVPVRCIIQHIILDLLLQDYAKHLNNKSVTLTIMMRGCLSAVICANFSFE